MNDFYQKEILIHTKTDILSQGFLKINYAPKNTHWGFFHPRLIQNKI